MDFPLIDLMDERACFEKLLALLHPDGLTCPRCGAGDRLGVHRRHRDPVLDYQCGRCGRVFNAFTGTPLQGIRRPPAQLLLILRGVAQATPTAQMARELGCDRKHLLQLRHQLQGNALLRLSRSAELFGSCRVSGGAIGIFCDRDDESSWLPETYGVPCRAPREVIHHLPDMSQLF